MQSHSEPHSYLLMCSTCNKGNIIHCFICVSHFHRRHKRASQLKYCNNDQIYDNLYALYAIDTGLCHFMSLFLFSYGIAPPFGSIH
ncbi:hypothetical protein AQUCO_01100200v1 [Aquilegia coerulea]|uniref:Uncharacterized protein n=1 Tax=Aquilegia coerulea TaxID=218851 RepID=A0A2G5E6M5_AQUCA|nr:hypothetical protein AQUCO_01100200v1 [Aquilegia coerulea]